MMVAPLPSDILVNSVSDNSNVSSSPKMDSSDSRTLGVESDNVLLSVDCFLCVIRNGNPDVRDECVQCERQRRTERDLIFGKDVPSAQ